jgi:hypothetical protein
VASKVLGYCAEKTLQAGSTQMYSVLIRNDTFLEDLGMTQRNFLQVKRLQKIKDTLLQLEEDNRNRFFPLFLNKLAGANYLEDLE